MGSERRTGSETGREISGRFFGRRKAARFLPPGGITVGKEHCTAIVLAAGRGSRMGTALPKQYLMLCGKPVLYYSLMAFQRSGVIDDIILVAESGREEYCKKEIVEKYGFTKVGAVAAGGAQRYDSVSSGLRFLPDEGYVFIHDGARPFVSPDMIERAFESVRKTKACVVAMPSKDTVKIADGCGNIEYTPERGRVWIAQTPQVFENRLIKEAYARLMRSPQIKATDDAMAVELMTDYKVALVQGSYENIKITTPEDLRAAQETAKRIDSLTEI